MRLRWLPLGMAMLAAIGCQGGCHGGKTSVTDKSILHVLVASNGRVELIKRDWTFYSPVSSGELISSNDILLVAEGGTAKIVCSDLSKRILQVGPPGPVPCPADGELTAIAPHLLMRSGTPGGCPILISPRAGRLLDPQPEVRWTAISETRDYTIALQAGGMHWRRELHLADDALEGSLPYPQDALPIPPGSPVTVTISGGGHVSDECAPRASELRMLTEAEQFPIRQADGRIKGLGLSALEAAYLRANLFLSHELYAEAIALLESISQASDAGVAVDRLLGDAYSSIELYDSARTAYQKALDRAGAFPDIEAEAALNDALARLTGDTRKRANFLDRAIALYTKLGDRKKVGELTHP